MTMPRGSRSVVRQPVVFQTDYGTLRWLYGLAKHRTRKTLKGVEHFAPKPGQSAEEAAEILAKFRRDHEWQQSVVDALEQAARPDDILIADV